VESISSVVRRSTGGEGGRRHAVGDAYADVKLHVAQRVALLAEPGEVGREVARER
jgi:hypothetical protein